MKAVRLTMAQALLRFLDAQYVEFDGVETKFVKGVGGIFGHGNVVGLGEALAQGNHGLTYFQGHNEQGAAHMATGYAKQKNRKQIFGRIRKWWKPRRRSTGKANPPGSSRGARLERNVR